MTHYFLGADVGSTKTHVAIADETGRVLSLGEGGPGNPDNVGYEGLRRTLEIATRSAVQQAGITLDQIAGAGFGVSGLDYPSQKAPTLQAIDRVGSVRSTRSRERRADRSGGGRDRRVGHRRRFGHGLQLLGLGS